MGPDTELDGRPASFWIEKDVGLPVGSTLLHYRLKGYLPTVTEFLTVRVAYSSDDLYGQGDREVVLREKIPNRQ